MVVHRITELDDPRLEPYRELRSRNWTEQSGLFVVEGPLLVEQLLQSRYAVRSVLLDEKFQGRFESMLPPDASVLLLDHALVSQLVGFDFHRGVLACGLRRELPDIHNLPQLAQDETLAALVGVQDPENLGGILRSCAAFGVRRILIGPGTADPLGRRALRVAIATTLHLDLYPVRRRHDRIATPDDAPPQLGSELDAGMPAPGDKRSRDSTLEFVRSLRWLKSQRGVRCVATSLDARAKPLERAERCGPTLILFGNERNGVPSAVLEEADELLRMDMELGTDSLNVCVAAGIVLHYFTRLAVVHPPDSN